MRIRLHKGCGEAADGKEQACLQQAGPTCTTPEKDHRGRYIINWGYIS